MAYREMYRSSSQSSTTSITAIDGIGIKLNEKLIPPPLVNLPTEWDHGNPSEVLFMEYDFSLEEHFLAVCRAQRENEQAQQQAETERVSERIASFAKPADEQSQPAAAQPTAEQLTPSQATSGATVSGSAAPVATSAAGGWGTQETGGPGPFMNLGSTILTPMPISAQGHARKESGGGKPGKGNIDLRDFENEEDIFENMELRVLNDREELNKVVLGLPAEPVTHAAAAAATTASQPQGEVHTMNRNGGLPTEVGRPSPSPSPINLKDVDYPEVESLDSAQFGVPETKPASGQFGSSQTTSYPPAGSTARPYYQPVGSTAMPYAQRPAGFYGQGMPLPPISSASYGAPHQPVVAGPSSSNVFMGTNTAGLNQQAGSGSSGVTLTSTAAVYSKLPADNVYVPYQNFYSRHNMNSTTTAAAAAAAATNGHGGMPGGGPGVAAMSHGQAVAAVNSGRETPPLAPLRSARSTPDISGSEERRLPPLLPSSHTPPPTSISRSMSHHDSMSEMSSPGRNWNHYNILPPTSGRSSVSVSSPSKLARTGRPEDGRQRLPDPHDSLSHNAQRLVESIADMGFPRARVARAVQRLGNDDKQVVDFLCLLNRLSEKGHDPDDTERALLLFENNLEKADQYLKLLAQFKELGFGERNIQEALVSTNLDENKTLDLLTSS